MPLPSEISDLLFAEFKSFLFFTDWMIPGGLGEKSFGNQASMCRNQRMVILFQQIQKSDIWQLISNKQQHKGTPRAFKSGNKSFCLAKKMFCCRWTFCLMVNKMVTLGTWATDWLGWDNTLTAVAFFCANCCFLGTKMHIMQCQKMDPIY